jgi:hypothetical protein
VSDAPRQPFTIPLADGPVAPAADRAVAALVVGIAVAAVAALAGVDPDPRGFDTHVQLGMTPCGWPLHYGMPCPTCGCTTAACLVVHGRWLGAHAAFCLLRRRSFVDLAVRVPLWKVTFFGVVLLLAAWGYKCLTFAPA